MELLNNNYCDNILKFLIKLFTNILNIKVLKM